MNIPNINRSNIEDKWTIFSIWTKDEIKEILTNEMTRNRDLKRVEENLPWLKLFIEREKEYGAKKIIELGSWEWLLADDIQNNYNIKVLRVDWYKSEMSSRPLPKGWIEKMRFDIRNFEKFPWSIPSVFSIHTLMYIPNAPEIIGHIYNKLKPNHWAYLQFINGLRSRKIIEEFEEKNRGKWNIRITCTKTDVIIELLKNEEDLAIPEYLSTNWFVMNWKNNQEIRNSKLFYRYLAKDNDPEWEKVEQMRQNTKNSLDNTQEEIQKQN